MSFFFPIYSGWFVLLIMMHSNTSFGKFRNCVFIHVFRIYGNHNKLNIWTHDWISRNFQPFILWTALILCILIELNAMEWKSWLRQKCATNDNGENTSAALPFSIGLWKHHYSEWLAIMMLRKMLNEMGKNVAARKATWYVMSTWLKSIYFFAQSC